MMQLMGTSPASEVTPLFSRGFPMVYEHEFSLPLGESSLSEQRANPVARCVVFAAAKEPSPAVKTSDPPGEREAELVCSKPLKSGLPSALSKSVLIRILLVCLALTLFPPAVDSAEQADQPKPTAEQTEFFEAKIRPILVEHCYQCHSTEAEEIEGGLVLDSKWGWQTGGDSGPAIVPGNLAESHLIDAVRYEENIVSAMPPKSKLPSDEIKLLERWVEMGAPDPRAKVEKGTASKVQAFDLAQRVERTLVVATDRRSCPARSAESVVAARGD